MSIWLALRYARREIAAGTAGFRIFVMCLALGVAAIAGVGTVGRNMLAAIGAEGRTILGGDLSVSLVQRGFSREERAALDALGRTSQVTLLRAMASLPDGSDQALVEIKAVDEAYPLLGQVAAEGAPSALALLTPDAAGRPPVLLEAIAVARLGLAVGAQVNLGPTPFHLAGILTTEPDRAGAGIAFGPRALIRAADLAATGLAEDGSLATRRVRVVLDGPIPDSAALKAATDALNARFPQAGWEIRARDDAAAGLRQNIGRFVQFLALVGFSALVVGGVGVANAVSAHLEARRPSIAALKCLGATGGFVFAVYLAEVVIIALIGIALGLLLGALLPLAAAGTITQFLAVPVSLAPHPAAMGLAAALGLSVAILFALVPLGRAHDVAPTAIFRASVDPLSGWPRRRYVVLLAAALLVTLALVLASTPDLRLTAVFLAGLAAVFAALSVVALAIRELARRLPHGAGTDWRMAVTALHRPGSATTSIVLSLGLGLTLIVALSLVDANLRRQLDRQLPDVAPNFFFADVKEGDRADLVKLLTAQAPTGRIVSVPMLRGRLVKLNGVAADPEKVASSAQWVLSGDRGITFSDTVPQNSRLARGAWWPAGYDGPPLVSFEADLAEGLGLALGDTITVNVMGREIEARIANLRKVEWTSLGINFVMVFSPDTFRGAPVGHLMTLALDHGGTADEARVLKAVARAFPSVTALRVKDAIEAASDIIRALTTGARLAAAGAVVASLLVLAGALASGQARRVREAVVLKVLGATRGRLLRIFALEYGLIGILVAGFALATGTLIAALVVTRAMGLSFAFLPAAALTPVSLGLVSTVLIGLTGTALALGRSSANELRDL